MDGIYTYALPPEMEGVGKGTAVLVPFAGNKKYTAIVCKVHDKEPQGHRVKAVEGLAEKDIYFSDTHLRFLFWMSEYYMAYPGDVIRAALPVAFRLESFTCVALNEGEIHYDELTPKEREVVRFLAPGQYLALKEIEKCLHLKNGVGIVRSLLNKGYIRIKETVDEVFREKTEKIVKWQRNLQEPELNGILGALKRAPMQYAMLCKWIESGKQEMKRGDFLLATNNSPAALKALCDKQILALEERVVSRLEEKDLQEGKAHELSPAQQQARTEILEEYATKECVLLQGVTSSGKTEIYIRLMKEFMDQGKQVLYMLPEIALTVQIIKRLRRVFGDAIGIYHSGMADSVRAELWKKQCSSQPYRLILGVRSSVFLPFQDLGLVIVDEEHDASYKQKDPAPRYHARDAAIMLARFYGAKVLLGSATPSFETYEHARSGKYGWVRLEERYGNIRMPRLVFADVAEYRRRKLMKGSFTPLLYEKVEQVLQNGKQVILFQNRRGYSVYLQCNKCGSIPKCPHCDVSMTYYKQRGVLSCRYCGTLRKVESVCGHCGTGVYKERTPGTERIEEEVERLFPAARVARMDLDVMSSKSRYHSVIENFEQGKTDILIGTQMVSKGLDFENVKLVGVIDADSMVNFPDFRAEERAYCMLMQVSGRSGRKGERGEVVIQTADKENRIYHLLQEGKYDDFYSELSEERQAFGYPPFCRLIRVELRHKEVVPVRNAANCLAGKLRAVLGKRVCGPAVPEVSRINGQNRIHLLLKIENGASFSKIKSLLKAACTDLNENKEWSGLRVICDVDPI